MPPSSRQLHQQSDLAIRVCGARKRYDRNRPVLDGLDMQVPRGTIYGLLGASGCGKTTLLSCIVGVRSLEEGEVSILGAAPGSRGLGVPGARIGYMPQEIALVQEFSVIGALYYFGRINGLEDHEIDKRHRELQELLELPTRDRLVKQMSGGQQRRVSLAAALVHRPELLVLDEPTVGLDPILRERIWDFLVRMAKEQGTTIVITTHYIEEARQAHRIGLMRCGRLLAETSPAVLLAKLRCETLEEAFFLLSCKQQQQNRTTAAAATSTTADKERPDNRHLGRRHLAPIPPTRAIDSHQQDKQQQQQQQQQRLRRYRHPTAKTFRALVVKNVLQFVRHPGGVLFAFVFPLVQVYLFFNAIGGDPLGTLAVVNHEAGDCHRGLYRGRVARDDEKHTCDYVDLSCWFLHGFDDDYVRKKFYDSLEEATAAVKSGRATGTLHFDRNFSRYMQMRRDVFEELSEGELARSEIAIRVDMGDRQTGLFMQKRLYERFFLVYQDLMEACGYPRKAAGLPLRLEQPIYGSLDQKYVNFVAPGFLLTVTFFLATAVSSAIIIADRHEGVWDRSLVQGVKTSEILFSHLLTQCAMIVIQVTITFLISFVYYQLPCRGSLLAVTALLFLNGLCGMCYGFLISVMCNSHTVANYVSTGSFYPVILLCGCIWPIEGMPKFLKIISLTLPTTIPSISLRGILDKGYPVTDPEVYVGFFTTLVWTASLVTLCLIGLRFKSK